MNHRRNNHQIKNFISLFSCTLVLLFFYCPFSFADESHADPGQNLKIEIYEENIQQLILIDENRMIISDVEYIHNHNTKFFSEDKFGLLNTISISKIIVPCLVGIQYKTFSVYTEAMPFNPEDRLLTDVVIKWQQEK